MTDIIKLTAAQTAEKIASGELTAVEVAEAHLARIEAVGPHAHRGRTRHVAALDGQETHVVGPVVACLQDRQFVRDMEDLRDNAGAQQREAVEQQDRDAADFHLGAAGGRL